MDEKSDYTARLEVAMKAAGKSLHDVAAALDVTYQAVKKALDGRSKSFSAENNSKAAQLLCVSTDWLATGCGPMTRRWPFTDELLHACNAASPNTVRRAENAARAALDMPSLPPLA